MGFHTPFSDIFILKGAWPLGCAKPIRLPFFCFWTKWPHSFISWEHCVLAWEKPVSLHSDNRFPLKYSFFTKIFNPSPKENTKRSFFIWNVYCIIHVWETYNIYMYGIYRLQIAKNKLSKSNFPKQTLQSILNQNLSKNFH